MTSPELAQFQPLDASGGPKGDPVRVAFNPGEYTLSKGAQIAEVAIPGLDSPILQFVRGQTETLTLDLFFDTTDMGMADDVTSVTKETDRFYQLVKIDPETHAPPVCLFTWGSEFPGHGTFSKGGSQGRSGFKCVVESVRQRYTLFSPKGVPLRATLTVTLREYKTLADQLKEVDPRTGDHTRSHVVERGETLSGISWRAYGDPEEWRRIADANRIEDPLSLPAGRVLAIPVLPTAPAFED